MPRWQKYGFGACVAHESESDTWLESPRRTSIEVPASERGLDALRGHLA
jgi:hypothetical protein